MKSSRHHRLHAAVPRAQSGQAMTEFIAAMIVLMPLFLAVTYVGRYGDIQLRTTQASRYAAFQRAMQPNTTLLSDAVLQDQMRARFFARGDALHAGQIQSDDSAATLGTKAQAALWRDLRGNALLKSTNDVTLKFVDAPLDAAAVKAAMGVVTTSSGKSWNPGKAAQVEVALVNKLDLGTAPEPLLKIGAATAAAGDGLGSAGSKDTRDAAATIVPTSKIPAILDSVLAVTVSLFEPRGPELGCIKPDVVPTGRLVGYQPVAACQ